MKHVDLDRAARCAVVVFSESGFYIAVMYLSNLFDIDQHYMSDILMETKQRYENLKAEYGIDFNYRHWEDGKYA